MDVKTLNIALPSPRPATLTCNSQPSCRIIPKHKKSFSQLSNWKNLNIPIPLTERNILTACTPRKIAEAHYRQRDIYDINFNLSLDKTFKENLELQEKMKKLEERKTKEEEFLALKEAKIKLRQDEIRKNKDDLKREQERISVRQRVAEEHKKVENSFQKDKRSQFMEYAYIRKKQEWENRVRDRDFSLDSARSKGKNF